jgi:hypothetical protein
VTGYVATIGRGNQAAEAAYQAHDFVATGSSCNGQDQSIRFDFPRDTHKNALLLVVAYRAPDGTPTDPLLCDAQHFRNCAIIRREFYAYEPKNVDLSGELDPRCIGKACSVDDTCQDGLCRSDWTKCTAEQDGPVSCAYDGPTANSPDPCPGNGPDAAAEASCGLGYCTGTTNTGIVCTCGGGDLDSGVACVGSPHTTGALLDGPDGAISGYRCLCDLGLNEGGYANP